MKRSLIYGFAALLALAFSPFIGCAPHDQDAGESQEIVSSSINYSLSESLKLPVLKSKKEYVDFTKSAEIAVVKFGATWCGPCQELAPQLEKMAGYFETAGVKFAEIDVDEVSDLAKELSISSIPYTVVFYRGNYYSEIVGYKPESIASLVDSLLQSETSEKDQAQPADDEDWSDKALDEADKPAPKPINNGWTAPEGPYSNSEPADMPMMETEEQFNAFVAENKYAVVEFGADWCIWCKLLHPEVLKMGGFHADKGLKLAEVDSNKLKDLAGRLGVGGIPHTILYRDGQKYDETIGCAPLELFEKINAMLDGKPVAEETVAKETEETDEAEATVPTEEASEAEAAAL